MRNDKKVALGARAESNGVVIYDNDFERRKIGFKAYVSETGELTSTRIMDNFTEREQILLANSIVFTKLAIMFIALIAITFLTAKLGIPWVSVAISFFIGFVWIDTNWALKIFVKTRCRKVPAEINRAKFHAAVHKSLNAYETHNRVPTIDEVKQASMYSSTCASLTFLTKGVFMTIIIIVYILVSTNSIASSAMPLMFPLMFLGKLKIFQKLEKIILLEPGEKEIECAIEALKEYENYNYWRN